MCTAATTATRMCHYYEGRSLNVALIAWRNNHWPTLIVFFEPSWIRLVGWEYKAIVQLKFKPFQVTLFSLGQVGAATCKLGHEKASVCLRGERSMHRAPVASSAWKPQDTLPAMANTRFGGNKVAKAVWCGSSPCVMQGSVLKGN